MCYCRMLEKVKLTDTAQLEREKMEKGFTLYVNGANDGKGSRGMRRKTPNPSPRGTAHSRLAAGDVFNINIVFIRHNVYTCQRCI